MKTIKTINPPDEDEIKVFENHIKETLEMKEGDTSA